MFKKYLFICKLFIAFGLVIYLIASKRLDLMVLYPLADHRNMVFIVTAIFFLFLNQYIVSFRLSYLLGSQGISISVKETFIINYIGLFFNNCLPGSSGGDVVRAYYIAKHQRGKGAEGVGVLVFDRLIGLCAMAVLALIGMFFCFMTGTLSLLSINIKWLLLIAGVLVFFLVIVAFFLFGGRFVNRKWVSWMDERGCFYRLCRAIGVFAKSPRTVAVSTLLSMASHLATLAGISILAITLSDYWSVWKYLVAIPLTVILSSIPISPGGIGWSEYLASIFWGVSGSSTGAAVFAAWRIVTVIFSMPAGFVYAFFLKRQKKHEAITVDIEDVPLACR